MSKAVSCMIKASVSPFRVTGVRGLARRRRGRNRLAGRVDKAVGLIETERDLNSKDHRGHWPSLCAAHGHSGSLPGC